MSYSVTKQLYRSCIIVDINIIITVTQIIYRLHQINVHHFRNGILVELKRERRYVVLLTESLCLNGTQGKTLLWITIQCKVWFMVMNILLLKNINRKWSMQVRRIKLLIISRCLDVQTHSPYYSVLRSV